ncbi:hypothetical protein MPSEU_000173700 [Mayamaea pseudoterrestris]|nr:hypothetical protein MPSEU_000173700 [Mayamaea pseudoterrestris]
MRVPPPSLRVSLPCNHSLQDKLKQRKPLNYMFDEKNLHAASSVTMEKEEEAEHDELILNYEEEMDERFFDVTRSDHDGNDTHQQPQPPQQNQQEANSLLLDNVAHGSSDSYHNFRELAQSAFAAPSSNGCSWHDAESDRPERQRMVIDISQLLYARKQGAQLTEQWLQELPHKARKLESCLYKQAASLDDYRNRDTLKWRLQRIARSITRQFLQAKSKQQVLAAAANETCIPSNGRDSFSPRQRRRSTGNIKPRSLGGEQGNGSLRDILLTHGSAESFSSTDADAADKIDFARSGMLRPIRRSSAAATTTNNSLSLVLASVPLEAASSDLMEQQSLETAQSLPSANEANASFEFEQQQPEQQQLLMGQEAAAATTNFYLNNNGLTSNHQLVETSESSATHREMQDLLTSQLLAQQQQIIRNIQQQEEMIQQLQQARLQQQGMPLGQHGGGVMMSADGSGNYAGPAAALYTPIQQMFIQEQERQQQLNAMYNGDFSSQQQFSMASLSTDQYTQSQMVMNGPMFQHQMGLPQTQLESQISMDFSNQSMLALDESARIQYALQNQQQQQQQQMLAPSQYSLMDGQQQQQQLLHPQQLLRSISGGMTYGNSSQATYDAQLAMPYDKPGDGGGGGLLALDAALAAHHAKTTDETDTRQRKRLSKDSFRW